MLFLVIEKSIFVKGKVTAVASRKFKGAEDIN